MIQSKSSSDALPSTTIRAEFPSADAHPGGLSPLRALRWCVLVGAVAALTACGGRRSADGNTERPQAVPEGVAKFVSTTPPASMETRRFIDFSSKVHLLGYTLSDPSPSTTVDRQGAEQPATEWNLTLFWKSAKSLGPGWRLFTHAVNRNGSFHNQDSNGPLRAEKGLPPSSWIPGQYYTDEQRIIVQNDASTSRVGLRVGLWKEHQFVTSEGVRTQGIRLNIVSGASDRVGRGIVADLVVSKD